jgi:hypothetical protein
MEIQNKPLTDRIIAAVIRVHKVKRVGREYHPNMNFDDVVL